MENEELQNQEAVNAENVQPVNNQDAAESQNAAPAFERKPRPQIEVTDDMVEKASSALTVMLDYLGLDGTVKAEKRPSKINLIVSSSDAGRIIGRKGQSLESLQLLLNRMMQNGAEDFPKVYIDIDGYSSNSKSAPADARDSRPPRRGGAERGERRSSSSGGERRSGGNRRAFESEEDDGKDEILRQQASDAAKEVRKWGEAVTLPQMNSHDRRIIHITLEEESDIHTESVGDGSLKSVVVSLKK